MKRRWAQLLVTALLLSAASASAATLQVRLVRATNGAKQTDDRLSDIEPKLKKKFGYAFYRLMGAQQTDLKDSITQRLDLGEGFVVFVKQKSTEKQAHELDIEWYSGKASLVKSTVKIGEGHHVFVKGPAVADDWILLALTVRE